MKRVISSFSPLDNPTDAARSSVAMLNSTITSVGNIVKGWANTIKYHPDDDSMMNKLVDDAAFMQSELDKILTHYNVR